MGVPPIHAEHAGSKKFPTIESTMRLRTKFVPFYRTPFEIPRGILTTDFHINHSIFIKKKQADIACLEIYPLVNFDPC